MPSSIPSEKIVFGLFALLLTGLPFSKAIVSIAFVGLILFSIFSILPLPFTKTKELSTSKEVSRLWSPPLKELLLLPALLFASLFISLLYSSNNNQGLKSLSSQIELIALPFIFWVNRAILKEQLTILLKIFLFATTIAAVITFTFFLLPTEVAQKIAATIPLLKEYVLHEKAFAFGVYSPFTERLQFSYLLGVGIFLNMWFWLKERNRKPKVGVTLKVVPTFLPKVSATFGSVRHLSSLLILLITLLLLGARGAQIGFLIGSLIWLIGGYMYWLHPFLRKKINPIFSWLLLIGSIVFFLFLLPAFAYKTIPAVQVRYDQMRWEIGTFQDGTFKNYDYTHFTSIRRLLSWRNSWNLIKEQPVLGVGIGDYQQAMEREYAKDGLGFPVNTQSQFLYYWTSAGLLGLFVFLVLLAYPFFYFIGQNNLPLKLLGVSFLSFYCLVFLFDAPLNFQVGGMTFWVFYCLLSFE